jgi:serine/threonine protein kinase
MTAAEADKSRLDYMASVGEDASKATVQDWGKHLVQSKQATLFQVSAAATGRPAKLRLGDYFLLDKLASGGMGDVYKGLDRKSGRVAVVKVLPAAAAEDRELVQRFEREIRLLSNIEHPNIVGAFSAGEADGAHFLAMEFVDGFDLGRIVKLRGPMAVEDAVECIRQAAVALGYAHEKGVIHRDVKPSNLMLDQQGMVKILDLGLARVLHNDDGLTSTGSVLGSIDYMAPEQGNDSKLADHRADLYALGCTLFYLLTGRLVFEGKNISQKLLAHQDSAPPLLRAACPDAPPKLEQLFLKMLAKDPANRPKKMADLVAALTKIVRDLPDPDLMRYLKGSTPRDHTPKAYGSTLPVAIPRPAPAVVIPAPITPAPPLRRRAVPTRAPGRHGPSWRAWTGGVAAVCLATALLAALLFNQI